MMRFDSGYAFFALDVLDGDEADALPYLLSKTGR